MKNYNYSKSFINVVISPKLNETHEVLNEIFIYEAFLDTIKTFLSNRYEETLTDLTASVKNTKDAAIVIKEIIKNEEYLDKVLTQLNKRIRETLKQLRAIVNEFKNTNETIVSSLTSLLNKLIQKTSYFFSIRGWKGFLASLGIYSIGRYLVLAIVEARNDIQKLTNLFSLQNTQTFDDKIDSFVSMIGGIASSSMSEFMGYFSSMGDILKIVLNVLSDIKKKLSFGVNSLTLTNETIVKKYKNYIKEVSSINMPRAKFIPDEYREWQVAMEDDDVINLGKIENYDLYKIINDEKLYDYVVLLDHVNKKTVAQMKLTQSDSFHEDFFIVKMIKGNPEYAGNNYSVKIYSKLIRLSYNFISDDTQSEGGKKIWAKLTQEPGVYVYAISKNSDGDLIYSDVDDDSSEIFSNIDVYSSEKTSKIRDKIDDIDEMLTLISKDIKDLYVSGFETKADALEKKYEDLLDQKEKYENEYYILLNNNMSSDEYYKRLIAIKEKIK